jgi:DNA polymerase-3 subunit delta
LQLKLSELERHLATGLKPMYLISGDEMLLVQEASASVIDAAERDGFAERAVIDGSSDMDWDRVFAEAGNLSLFSERRVLDVRLPTKAFDRTASDALRAYLASPYDDTIILMRTGRLEVRQRRSSWFKAVVAAGAVVLVWPLRSHELPRWLEQRSRAAGLELTRDAIALLADSVEGNLLAALQEIQKLKLARSESRIDVDALRDAVGDASHFDTFELVDAAFNAAPERVRKMIRVLRQEGVPVYLIMGVVTSQLRSAQKIAMGGRPQLSSQRARVLQGLANRFGVSGLERALSECALLDLQAKGMLRGDAWQSLECLLVSLAGIPMRGLVTEVDYLSYS